MLDMTGRHTQTRTRKKTEIELENREGNQTNTCKFTRTQSHRVKFVSNMINDLYNYV